MVIFSINEKVQSNNALKKLKIWVGTDLVE